MPAIGRRRFLRLLGQGALLASLPASPLWGDDADTVTVSILHTTDLHGHILPTVDYEGHADLGGLARCASQLRQWRRENPNSILVDIGDVYQGTEAGLLDRGATMIRAFNALAYDAWVIGNHEFDWGADALGHALNLSNMPALGANLLVEGRTPASGSTTWAKIRPYLVREVAGLRLAVIGLTTPGLDFWTPPENLGGFEALDPVETLRSVLAEISALKPDAIVLAGHMGLKRMDDFANQIGTLTREFPQIVACIGGHTHQNQPSVIINNVLYTQADHFGIHAGKLDLTFDRASRKLLRRDAVTVLMDHQIALDPTVLSLAQAELSAADLVLARRIGELIEPLGIAAPPGQASDVERLIASGMMAALRKKGVAVDAVWHGLFENAQLLTVGAKTVGDAWSVLPYENDMVTLDLAYPDLLALAREGAVAREPRHLTGLAVAGESVGRNYQVDAVLNPDRTSLTPKPFYRVALNAYDAQSAGQRLPVARQLAASPGNHRVFHSISTRDALIDFFVERGRVGMSSLLA